MRALNTLGILVTIGVAACTGAAPHGAPPPSLPVPERPSPPKASMPAVSLAPATPSPHSFRDPTVDGRFAVDDSGREIAMICWGEGSPTVILETGGPNIQQWTGSGMVGQLADQTRVCTYDRAGTGASDPPPFERRDADDVVNELHRVLIAAGVGGPYVMLGRSFGGMVATYYAERFPDEVRGVVVLDTPAPDATFTEASEPGLVWDYAGNTERLDVVGGFENRFARRPPKLEVPLLLITPVPGEASAENEGFWLQVSPSSRQVELPCGSEPDGGPCASAVADFVSRLRD